MTTLLLVALGSALSAPARYLRDRFIQGRRERVRPWGTWTINLTGSDCGVRRSRGRAAVVSNDVNVRPDGGNRPRFFGRKSWPEADLRGGASVVG